MAVAKKSTTSKSSSRCSAANQYKSNGITISPSNFSSGDKIKVTYTGLLSQSGANEIYAHIGWGDSWENVDDIKMSKTSGIEIAAVVSVFIRFSFFLFLLNVFKHLRCSHSQQHRIVDKCQRRKSDQQENKQFIG